MKPLRIVAILFILQVTYESPTSGSPAYAIHRIGNSSTPGDLIRLDTESPQAGVLIGNLGIGNVGTMDYFNGDLWAVSGDNNVMSFYTIDPEASQATLRSSFDGPFGGTSVFSGSFDDDGYYWVVDFINDNIRMMDPWTGASLHSAPIGSSVGYNGVAFVGETLYAVRGGDGDPLQEFGILDTVTGLFSSIGSTGVGIGGSGGGNGTGALDYDSATDTMYLVYRAGVQIGQFWSLYTIDMTTGAASFVNEIRPQRNIDAFAVVPEPATLGLFLLGVPLVLKRRRR